MRYEEKAYMGLIANELLERKWKWRPMQAFYWEHSESLLESGLGSQEVERGVVYVKHFLKYC